MAAIKTYNTFSLFAIGVHTEIPSRYYRRIEPFLLRFDAVATTPYGYANCCAASRAPHEPIGGWSGIPRPHEAEGRRSRLRMRPGWGRKAVLPLVFQSGGRAGPCRVSLQSGLTPSLVSGDATAALSISLSLPVVIQLRYPVWKNTMAKRAPHVPHILARLGFQFPQSWHSSTLRFHLEGDRRRGSVAPARGSWGSSWGKPNLERKKVGKTVGYGLQMGLGACQKLV